MTTQLITWAAQIGGEHSVEFLIAEVREAVAGLVDSDAVDLVTDAVREALYAERT